MKILNQQVFDSNIAHSANRELALSGKDARRESDINRFRSEDQGYLLKPAKI